MKKNVCGLVFCLFISGCAPKEYFESKKIASQAQGEVVTALLAPFTKVNDNPVHFPENPVQQQTIMPVIDIMNGDVAVHRIPVVTEGGGSNDLMKYLAAQEKTKQFEAMRDAVISVAESTKIKIADPYNPSDNIKTGISALLNPVNLGIIGLWKSATTGIEHAGHNNADKGGSVNGNAGSAPETTATTNITGAQQGE